MIFHTVQKKVRTPTLVLDGSVIEFVKEFNYLGIILDAHLTWKPHISHVSKKIAKTNGILTRLKNFLPPNILLLLYNSLILPYLNYGILVWGTHLDSIFKLQKKSVRIILKAKYNAHSEPIFKLLGLLKIFDILKLNELKFMYKLENNTLPKNFLSSMFVLNSDVHSYDTRHANDVRIPQSRHDFVKNSVRFRLPEVMNDAPTSVKNKISTHSIQGFSKFVKLQMIDRYRFTCHIPRCPICRNS